MSYTVIIDGKEIVITEDTREILDRLASALQNAEVNMQGLQGVVEIKKGGLYGNILQFLEKVSGKAYGAGKLYILWWTPLAGQQTVFFKI